MQKKLDPPDPAVSVVLTTFNRVELLPRAIASVLTQTFTNFELIIVDDCSQDQTAAVVEGYEDKRINYLKHEENKGLSAARNTGVCHANSDYIAFLDDDDEWLPMKLEKQVQLIHGLPESVGMVYCWMDYYDGEKVVAERHPELRGDIFDQVLASHPLGNGSTWLVRKSAIQTTGGFDEGLPRGVDGDFVRRMCLYYEVSYVPEVLVKYHVGHEKRITASSKNRWENGIRAQLTKLKKFSDELAELPKVKANIYLKLAYFYCMKGVPKEGIRYWLKCLKSNPFLFFRACYFLLKCLANRAYGVFFSR
jgi:glycosyltransferase involved in cell wall biosynthesis